MSVAGCHGLPPATEILHPLPLLVPNLGDSPFLQRLPRNTHTPILWVSMKVALAHINPTVGDFEGNAAKIGQAAPLGSLAKTGMLRT